MCHNESRVSSLGIVTTPWAGQLGIRLQAQERYVLLLQNVHKILGPPSLVLIGTDGSFLGIKEAGYEDDHS
jgi:hypothetical protein